jgi:hypothetical protein
VRRVSFLAIGLVVQGLISQSTGFEVHPEVIITIDRGELIIQVCEFDVTYLYRLALLAYDFGLQRRTE